MTRFLIGMGSGLFGFESVREGVVPLLPSLQPMALAVDPSVPARIYCATYNRGLWRSEDAGAAWRAVGAPQSFYGPSTSGAIGPRETTFVSVSPAPESDGKHAVWVGVEMSALYRSTDHGETFALASALDLPSRRTWSFPPRPQTHHVHRIAHDDAGGVHVAIEFGAILRSRDGGGTFEDRRPDSPLDTHVLLTHPQAPGRLYAALGDALLNAGRSFAESRDNGETWRYFGRGLEAAPYLYGLAVNPGDPEDMRVAASRSPQAAHATGGASIFRRDGDAWVEDAEDFPSGTSLIPVLTADPARSGRWFALSDLGLFVKEGNARSWTRLTGSDEWRGVHPMSLAIVEA
jgi:hypothetical protein